MGNTQILFPSTADCLQMGKADTFNFSWHQPKKSSIEGRNEVVGKRSFGFICSFYELLKVHVGI